MKPGDLPPASPNVYRRDQVMAPWEQPRISALLPFPAGSRNAGESLGAFVQRNDGAISSLPWAGVQESQKSGACACIPRGPQKHSTRGKCCNAPAITDFRWTTRASEKSQNTEA